MRPRYHIVGISLCLVFQPLAVLAGLDRIVERGLHLLGRLHVLQGHRGHDNASLVTIKNFLRQGLHIACDLLAPLVKHIVEGLVADHLAHRSFSRLRHGVVRAAIVVEVLHHIVDAVLNREPHVDDVLVLGQHGRFGQAGCLDLAAAPDLDRTHLRHVDDLVGLERIRQPPMKTSVGDIGQFAEARDRRLLTFLHDEESGGQPAQDADQHQDDDPHPHALGRGVEIGPLRRSAAAVAPTTLLAEHAVELAVEIAPELIEIGRAATARTAIGILVVIALVAVRAIVLAPTRVVEVEQTGERPQ